MSKYDDIIDMERPISKRKPMSIENRAAQFAPFSALTGYSEAVKETGRLTDEKKNLTEGIKEIINEKLNYIRKNISEIDIVNITYFIKDNKKSGGRYFTKTGRIKKIGTDFLLMFDGEKIFFDDISDISADVFNYLEM